METRDTRGTAYGESRTIGREERIEIERDVPDVRTPAERAALHERDNRSIADLLKELRDESTALLRQEVALAKTEMSEKASKAARNAAYIGAGGTVAYMGGLLILIAASIGLSLLLVRYADLEVAGWWLGPLIVGAIVAAIGCAMLQKGISTLKKQSLVPEKTVQSLQEDKQWIQDKVTK